MNVRSSQKDNFLLIQSVSFLKYPVISVAYHTLEQRLASAEERCSTISQHFSINNSTLNSKLTEEMAKINCHFSEAVGGAYDILSHILQRTMSATLYITYICTEVY